MMTSVRTRIFPNATASLTPGGQQRMGRQNYAAKIERLDYWLGVYTDFLRANGELNRTIICVVGGG